MAGGFLYKNLLKGKMQNEKEVCVILKRDWGRSYVCKVKIKIDGVYYDVDRILKDGNNYIKIRDLEQVGFKISNEGNVALQKQNKYGFC